MDLIIRGLTRDRIEYLIGAGTLSPAARDMSVKDIVRQYAEAHAMTEAQAQLRDLELPAVLIITVTYVGPRDEHDSDWDGPTTEDYAAADQEMIYPESLAEAVKQFTSRGLEFKATGAAWAGSPDGAYQHPYRNEYEEVTGHLVGFGRYATVIRRAVDQPDACPACGDAPDYCAGHGEIGDPDGFAILASLSDE